MDWLKKEWELQWPLVRFEVYKWVGILAASSFIAIAAKLLHGILHVPDSYFYPGLGLACVFVLVIATRNQKYGERRARQGYEGESTAIAQTVPEPNAVDEFYKTYDNRLLTEFEELIYTEARKYAAGNDRERFLVRLFASSLIIAAFEQIWLLIYRSQVLALQALNVGPMELETLRGFYDAVAAGTPAHTAGYPFTTWLAFMKDHVLAREEGTRVGITVRGQEFLKYLIQTNRHPDQLSN